MELTVTQENLSKALAIASRIASTRTQLPILSNILFRADENQLMVAATNLELATTQYLGAKIAGNGAITIPSRLITEFVSNLPKTNVTLKVDKDKIHITADGYKSIINGVVADDFPELPVIDEKKAVSYSFDPSVLKQAINQTILTTSNDMSRPVLTGVYWHSHEGYLYLASTDGYRLAERKLIKTTSEVSAIVPASTLQEVLRVLDEGDEMVVLFDELQVRFRIGNTEITSRLIDGNFPDFRQLIRNEAETEITVKRSDFNQITKVAGLFARDSGGSVAITASHDDGKLSLHSVASEMGENTSETAAKVTADGQVTLNSRYLLDALSVVDADEVSFSFSGKLSPCVLRNASKKDVDYRHVVMPLKN